MILISVLLFVSPASAQSYEDFSAYLAAIRPQAAAGTIPALPYGWLRTNANDVSLVADIQTGAEDTVQIIRRVAYQAAEVVVGASSSSAIRQNAFSVLMSGLSDNDLALQGIVLQLLATQDGALFSDEDLRVLISKLDAGIPGKEALLKLLGRLNASEATEEIRQFTTAGNKATIRWAAYLALARLGDEEAIDRLIQKVNGLTVNSDVVYDILPGLIYTRQKEVFDLLVKELYNDERNCEPADPDQYRPIRCGYRIMELLAPHVEGFPVAVSASGDLDTRNYRQALLGVREWFAANPNYQLTEPRD
ncbi:HEAT repeat domain-containing protein [Marinoscillum furvescens]|uniref:HEAT repeat domain-containing protein n=1 Tax=Marinoscillum furvescens TaxID=1026 RepID=UPI0011C04FD4|nr:HEAT repeat domain-containing protein [Marinoscillum furvescens]